MLYKKRNFTALAFLTPNFLGFLIFTSIPVVAAFGLALYEWDIFNEPKFVGLRNFIDLLGWESVIDEETGKQVTRMNDPEFWKYLWNTIFFMMSIPISIAGSMFLAVVLNQKMRGRVMFRTVFFIPSVCAGVGIMLLWKWLYNPEFGLINNMLLACGWPQDHLPKWLNSYHMAKPAIMAMGIWGGVGGTSMILYLAGLQGIDPELYDAADVDGATGWQKFIHITYPMLMPTTFFILITSVIGGFQGGFESAYIMTGGGPQGSTTTIVYYIYNHAFKWFNMGYAAAIAIVLFVIVLVATIANWKYGGKKVQYV